MSPRLRRAPGLPRLGPLDRHRPPEGPKRRGNSSARLFTMRTPTPSRRAAAAAAFLALAAAPARSQTVAPIGRPLAPAGGAAFAVGRAAASIPSSAGLLPSAPGTLSAVPSPLPALVAPAPVAAAPFAAAAAPAEPAASAEDALDRRVADRLERVRASFGDVHSYSEPESVRVTHVDLDLDVLFDQKTLKGSAELRIERAPGARGAPLLLDTEDLAIDRIFSSADGKTFAPASFTLGTVDPIFGRPLRVDLPEDATRVRVEYRTSPDAKALQWLEPAQTAGGEHPYLLTQSEAIRARSWIPLQDSPGVRVTYAAKVRVPAPLTAVMSAAGNTQGVVPPAGPDGTREFAFRMDKPIPSYLIALGVGELGFRSLGEPAGVYTEPALLERAAREFEDVGEMIKAVARLAGPYEWGRYDVLVLPPSFPLAGMENAMLTFATPTLLVGDKSLVSTLAHELAHSWAGNRTTNATWSDLWLNEGFTVYLERRILEVVYGKKAAEIGWIMGRARLDREMARLEPREQVLHVDLWGRDPEDGATSVAYEKGALFVRALEEAFGRERFDRFLLGYFAHFAFRSVTTADFVAYLKERLLAQAPALAATVPVERWIYEPGIPDGAPVSRSAAFDAVDALSRRWLDGAVSAKALRAEASAWSYPEYHRFLATLPAELGAGRMAELDAEFGFTRAANVEIAAEWLRLAIHNRYAAADGRLEEFLASVGRVKFLRPLYSELASTPAGRSRAREIFAAARTGYHPYAVRDVVDILR